MFMGSVSRRAPTSRARISVWTLRSRSSRSRSRSTPRSSKVFVCPRVRRSLGIAVSPLPFSSCRGPSSGRLRARPPSKSLSSRMKGLLEGTVGDGRARDLERLDGVGGITFQRELRQYSTDEARELEGVPRAYRYRDLRILRQRVQNEVLVRRYGVWARPSAQLRPEETWDMPPQKIPITLQANRVGLKGPGLRSHLVPAHVLA